MYIIVEGGECSGKTTQADLLADSMKAAGLPVLRTREPGGSKPAEKIRKILLAKRLKMSARTELFLFEAARSACMEDVVIPALFSGKTVVSDRSFPSTVAYQGFGGGMSLPFIEALNQEAMRGAEPDLIVIVDISYDTFFSRIRSRGDKKDRIESQPEEYHRKVLDGYREFAATHKRAVAVDGNGTLQQVHDLIVEVVNRKLGLSITACSL